MASQTRIRRRDALKLIGAASTLSWASPRILRGASGANERIQLAVIGCGGMGTRHIEALSINPNCTLVALCDCFKPRYENGMGVVNKLSGKPTKGYQDFRQVLDSKEVEAILAPTCDHWHPLMVMLGCEAGKDVYVEKPASPTVAEGRAMVQAARRYGRIVQLGTQQRSMTIFQDAMKLIHSGQLGQITSATCWVGTNSWFGDEHPGKPPEGLDWNMWLGPSPSVQYSPERHYGFMGWHDYCRGGQLTNWGVHLMDIVHWGIQQDRPLSVQAVGGSYRAGAGSDNYENVDVLWEYPGCTVTWEQRHSNEYQTRSYGIKFQGTDGQLLIDRNTFEILPASPKFPKYIGEPEKSWAHPPHHNNFFECIKTRKRPAAEIEQGHRSTTPVLLAGIALKMQRKLYWDGETETFVNDAQANRLLTRSYRPPWHM